MPAASIALAVWLSIGAPALAGGGQDTRGTANLTAALRSPDPSARAQAACALRDLGDGASPAIPALADLLDDPTPVERRVCEERWRGGDAATSPGEIAAAALVAIGRRAYQALEDAARSPAWVARRNAVWALGALDDERATPVLLAALADREPPVREQAAWALGALDAREAVDPLMKALADSHPGVRARAAWALGAIDVARAAPALAKALRDGDPDVRANAAWALGAIDADSAVDPLIAVLTDSDVRVRRQAAWALGAIGHAKAVSGLIRALEDTDAGVRRQAAWALGAVAR